MKDAIVVHCDMESKATCVLAKPEMSQEFTYQRRARGIVWLGDEICPGYEVGGSSLDHQRSSIFLYFNYILLSVHLDNH